MFADAVHHIWKPGKWVNKKTREIRSGRFLYNREYDSFTVHLDKGGKGTREIKRFCLSQLSFDSWEHEEF